MMGCIQLDLRGALSFLSEREIRQMELAAETAKGELVEHTGAGNDFHGWVDLPEAYDREEFARIQKAAAKIQAESEILVVAGNRRLLPRRARGQSTSCATASTTSFRRKCGRRRRFILSATI